MADKDHEAALAELLGEVGPLEDKNAGGVRSANGAEGVHTGEDDADVSVERELNLGPLDITSARVNDVFAALEEGGLDLDLVKYADHDVVRSVMENRDATDLKQRAKAVEEKLQSVEMESIKDYVAESDNLLELHAQIQGCDGILGDMESLLSGFKTELGKISTEIRSLQDQSQSMGIKLKNRKAAERGLSAFVDSITLPPDLVRAIAEEDVSERYLSSLADLDRRLKSVEANPSARASKAAEDVVPELERLKASACAKSREFLMARFYSLRKPKTNVQILQQNSIMPYKYLVTFLANHAPAILTEVRACYVDTMSKVLRQAIHGYVTSLRSLQQEIASRTDLLGSEEGAAGGGAGSFFAQFGGAKSAAALKNRSSVFSLGARAAVLGNLETTPPLIVHQVQSQGHKVPHEALFRSSHKLLMDTATFEYLFCVEFWQQDRTIFNDVFAPTIATMEENLQLGLAHGGASNVFGGNFDAIGLLLMIMVNREHRVVMSRRRVPCLDHYLDGVNMTLWPKFKEVFDAHLQSVLAANVNAMFKDDVRAHYVARRYAEFAASMVALGGGGSLSGGESDGFIGDGQLDSNLERLRLAVHALLQKLAKKFPGKKRGTVFLFNNFDTICAVVREARPIFLKYDENGGGQTFINETFKFFDEQLAAQSDAFVEEELADHFGPLIEFVNNAEKGSSEGDGGAAPSLQQATQLMRDFAERWKGAIERIHAEVIKNFGNLQRGMDVLQRTLSQLLVYYTRFTGPDGVLAKMGPDGAALCKDAVTNPAFMYEIKRHSQSRIN